MNALVPQRQGSQMPPAHPLLIYQVQKTMAERETEGDGRREDLGVKPPGPARSCLEQPQVDAGTGRCCTGSAMVWPLLLLQCLSLPNTNIYCLIDHKADVAS